MRAYYYRGTGRNFEQSEKSATTDERSINGHREREGDAGQGGLGQRSGEQERGTVEPKKDGDRGRRAGTNLELHNSSGGMIYDERYRRRAAAIRYNINNYHRFRA